MVKISWSSTEAELRWVTTRVPFASRSVIFEVISVNSEVGSKEIELALSV